MNRNLLWTLIVGICIILIFAFIAPAIFPGIWTDPSYSMHSMSPWRCFGGGMFVFPLIMLFIILIIVVSLLGKGDSRLPLQDPNRYSGESAIDILKKRYAKGEITKNEFEQMKKDLL